MALNEITFVNTNGEEINLSNIVNQMINYYGLKLEIGETRITDFNEGSEIRNLLEAFAIAIYALLEEQHEATRISFISTSYGGWLDKIGELPFIDLPRVESSYGQGYVTFTLSSSQASDVVIPADTVLACSGTGLEFVTTSECVIAAGDLSGDASVECLTTGADGNVVAGSVDVISDDGVDTDLVSVSNASAFGGGADAEDDEDYRERLLSNVRRDGFGTLGYYENLCLDIDGVHDVLFVSDASYTRKVLVNGNTKPTSDVVLLDVLTALTENSNHVLGHSFTVAKPAYSSGHTLAITLNVKSALSTTALTNLVSAVFNGGAVFQMDYEGLSINESLDKQVLVSALETFDDVVSVTSIKESGNEITSLTPSSNDVLTLTAVSFTQNEV